MKQFILGAAFVAAALVCMGADIDRGQMRTARQSVKALAAKVRTGQATQTEKDQMLSEMAFILLGE